MRQILIALVACVGLSLASGSAKADGYGHGHYGHSYGHGHYGHGYGYGHYGHGYGHHGHGNGGYYYPTVHQHYVPYTPVYQHIDVHPPFHGYGYNHCD